ncbi:type IV pilus biogenesis protein PilM [Jeotgalibacillus haloalkalitolerans]|uniref:Pilus assembly protein PilM n=1 Tax=Jeotgalibacillus haloalkalitolerans TaxID=3104292 RepID=A0ABU5KNU9_9BACL|nr:pilus assembly protein PilM [Jeotgalibacillus sp. HH7-29]MDZ5712365.1 pilus assembly protein PilM [Jeotgalibacillus sp. HH7-29]
MNLFPPKKTVSLMIQDYVIRMAASAKGSGQSITLREEPLPVGMIEDGQIVDEQKFYELMKELVDSWDLKKSRVQFFVPDSSVLMKPVMIPSDIKQEALKEYFMMEAGQSLHFPFEDPLIDVIRLEQVTKSRTGQGETPGILFASPHEDITAYANAFEDVKMKPVAAEIRALAIHRFLDSLQFLKKSKTYLISEWSLNALNISIFSENVIDFMRYQSIETVLSDWKPERDGEELHFTFHGDQAFYEQQLEDRIAEIERLMNFYRFSLHKGEKEIDEIILTGDNPYLKEIGQKLESYYQLPVTITDETFLDTYHQGLKAKHTGLIGLMQKEAGR